MTRKEKMLKSAIAYATKFNFSIIPSGKEKQPLIAWKEYQTRIPTIEEITQWWGNDFPGANISLVCGKISDRVVVDIDKYKDPHALDRIENAMPESLLMPIVDTPRGGEHRHFLWDENAKSSGDNPYAIDVKSEGGLALLPPSEFQGKEYAWRNGFNVKQTATPPLPASLIDLFISLYGFKQRNGLIDNQYTATGMPTANVHTCPLNVHTPSTGVHNCRQIIKIPDGRRDHKLFHLANFLIKSGMPKDEVQDYLVMFARYCCENEGKPYTDQEALLKVESAMKREYDKTKSLAEMVREFIDDANGTFMSSDVHKYTQVSSRKELKNVSTILRRMVEDRIIERSGNKNGCWRKVTNDLGLKSIKDIKPGQHFDARLPFGFERYVDIFPKDIIAFAGAPNVGKTTLMIECAKLNMNRNKVYYWSSETGAENMIQRLAKSDEVRCSEWDFAISDQFDENFEDAVGHNPDGVHIFDYIEATDGEYYKIPSKLSRIHARLKNGIAFVALQKKEGGGAYGGQQTEAKPSVFFTIDRQHQGNIMRVKKAKNFPDENPNGFCINFKIVKGIKLLPQGIWMPELQGG
jgi:hypothetical protein